MRNRIQSPVVVLIALFVAGSALAVPAAAECCRCAAAADQRISLEAKDLPVQRLAELLSRALGHEVTIGSDPGEKVSLQLEEVPVEKVLRLFAKTAEVRVDGEQILP